MKTNCFRIIFTTLAFSLLCENKVQAAVESLGKKASITIPNAWTVSERTASTLVALSPSKAVEISISHNVPDESGLKSTIFGGTYEEWNNIIEVYLNSIELDMMQAFTGYGYPITKIAENPVFSGGVSENTDFYAGRVKRNYSIFANSLIINMSVTSQFLTDGARSYWVRMIIYDWAIQSEKNEAVQTLGSLKSTNIIAPLSDLDGDGRSNFDEIILYDTNPNVKDLPKGYLYQGPTITSMLTNITVPVSKSIKPYSVTTNFGANVFSASGLPAGITVNSNTGLISGKPIKKGKYSARITASKKSGDLISHSVTASR